MLKYELRTMTAETEYVTMLIRAVISNEIPPVPQKELDWNKFHKFVVSNKLEGIIFTALSQIDSKIPQALLDDLSELSEMALVNDAIQGIELDTLIAEFEKEHIKCLVMKGTEIKALYPLPEHRHSSDIDILVTKKDLEKVSQIMKRLGYTPDGKDEFELHCGYRKPPNVLVEIHDRLVERNNRSYNCFKNIWDSVVLKDGYSYRYSMDKEMFYVFIVAHLCKHIKRGGAGIRLITDIWVLISSWENEFDSDRLSSLLKKAQLTEFNHMAVSLARAWFNGEEIPDEDTAVLGDFVLRSGCFGTTEQSKSLKASAATDSKKDMSGYIVKRALFLTFPPHHIMRNEYPILIEHKWLLPVMWLHRIFGLLTKGRKSLPGQIRHSMNINAEESKRLRGLWDAVN